MSAAPPVPPAPAVPGLLASAARNDRRLFESLSEGIWERDLRTGEVWYSPRYKELLGFTDDELANRIEAISDRIHPDDMPGLIEAYARAERDLCDAEIQARVRVKDGHWRWFRARARVWPDADGHPAVLVGALFDVHEEVVATEALKAHQAVLEERVRERTQGLQAALQQAEAERLAAERANLAKAVFLAHMSHELRTPLNGVLGMNQLAQPLAVVPEQRRYLELANQSGQALLRILDDVLDFARVEAGRLQLADDAFDLAQLGVETLRGFMPDVRRKGLRVGFDYVGTVTKVRGDAGRVRQILSNLIGNAIKFTEQGHILLIIEAADAEADGRSRVRVRMRDTGVGMDEATAARVFEPFEQADPALNRRHGGTGLGLSLVRLLATAMGGDVSLRSRPGRGSEFRVELRLPVLADQPLRALAAAGTPPRHVWLITRSEAGTATMRTRVARLGWTWDALESIESAVARLAAGEPLRRPDCVLISEDALTAHTDFGSLRRVLPTGTPVTLLLRADFDLRTVHTAAEQWQVCVALAPLGPAELYAIGQRQVDDVEPRPAAERGPAHSGAPRPSVLVVEDNLMNQIIAREMVAALGLAPTVVGSGEEALTSCQCAAPDLVLMDVQMPGMDGLEATRRLRALQAAGQLPRFPIIALTAHAMSSDHEASRDAGMDAHLTKPVQLEQLRSCLDRWLSRPAPR